MKRVLIAAAVLLAGCASPDKPIATVITPSNTSGYIGTYLTKPFKKPDVTLTDTKGQPFNIAKDTKGKVTALYFGYTHCPDVCPTTMADLSVAMDSLPKDVADQIDVVFVTTDPQRDTPKATAAWLRSFSWDHMVGLTGKESQIQDAAEQVAIFIAPPVKKPDGSVVVEHGAQVILFDKQGNGDIVFASAFQPGEMAHDLQKLVEQQ